MEEAGVALDVDSISALMSDSSRDSFLRFRAALALGQLGDESAITVLQHALVDPEVHVRAGAAAALRYLPRNDSASPLCRTAMYDVDEVPRHNAVLALGTIETFEATTCLETVIANELETAKVREFAKVVLEQHLERMNEPSDR
jgi:HEAT repeat protein